MNSTNSTELSEQANRGCFYLTRFLAYDREPAVKILFIVNCALNAILSIIAIVGNASIFWALRRCSSTLRPPSKALLSSLTLSDLAVGLFVQPLYVVYKAAEMNGHFQLFCITGIGFHLTANVFQAVSFLIVTAIALDRFLAFHLQKLYTRISATRAKVLLVILWSATGFWIITWLYNIRIYQAFNITAVSLCLLVCASAYITLQYRLRGLQTAITSRLNPFNEREANISIQTPHLQLYRRSVTTMFYIYILLILCYTPYWSMFIVIQLTGRNYSKIVALSLSMTIVFANASLNPFLYCWRIQEIRREIVSAISKLCRRN